MWDGKNAAKAAMDHMSDTVKLNPGGVMGSESPRGQQPAQEGPDTVQVGVPGPSNGAPSGAVQRPREGSTLEVVDGEAIGVQAGQGVPPQGQQAIDPEAGTYEALMAAFAGPGGMGGPISPPPG